MGAFEEVAAALKAAREDFLRLGPAFGRGGAVEVMAVRLEVSSAGDDLSDGSDGLVSAVEEEAPSGEENISIGRPSFFCFFMNA